MEGFHYNPSMYITCQTELEFAVAHNKAMDKIEHTYYFKSLLPHVNAEAKE